MKKSFSLIELIIVIIIVGILYSTVSFSLSNTSLNQAADQIISHINYTRHLALKDNKMQYYPINNTNTETNRSKYWFKQWWHLKITDVNNSDGDRDIIYYIFSDSPTQSNSTMFNKITTGSGQHKKELAINPLNSKYFIGASKEETNNVQYPIEEKITKQLNLTKTYNIQKIILENGYSSSSMQNNKGDRIDLLFDNYGNIYMSEGDKGDNNDINPYDEDKRIALLKTAKIILCQDSNCDINISICLSPKIGNAYLCK